ncbi:hypothetical protein [Streptomyces anulatus]|uniref:hypothetical protein n=1 Tax=Streptomyces anulatus TaxID=1892 RepID=UPI00364B8CA0
MRIGEALGLRHEGMHFLTDSQAFVCQVKGPHVHVQRRLNSNGVWASSRKSRHPGGRRPRHLLSGRLHERSEAPQADFPVRQLH